MGAPAWPFTTAVKVPVVGFGEVTEAILNKADTKKTPPALVEIKPVVAL